VNTTRLGNGMRHQYQTHFAQPTQSARSRRALAAGRRRKRAASPPGRRNDVARPLGLRRARAARRTATASGALGR
jgi:hypothetical protein